ncbi:MAG: hypothetical protein R3F43_27295 [bacterium]
MSGLAIPLLRQPGARLQDPRQGHWRVPDYVRYYQAQGSLLQAVAGVGHRYMTLVARRSTTTSSTAASRASRPRRPTRSGPASCASAPT